MLVFGGKDDENEKLSDLWMYNFGTDKWEKLATKNPEPTPRSGHTMVVYRDFIIVFGGIYMLTQELNDLYLYDLKNRNWICLFDEEGANQGNRSPTTAHKGDGSVSPMKRRTLGNSDFRDKSSLKDRMDQESVENADSSISPKKNKEKTLRGTMKTIAVLASYPQKPPKTAKQGNTHQEKNQEESQHELSSPTSITMRNTFIIKNADSSFDNYYQMMKLKQKRQTIVNQASFNYGGVSPSKISNMHSHTEAKGLQ